MSGATVTVSVQLPSDSYLAIEQLARVLDVSVSHAAALTIFAGQQAQQSHQQINETLEIQLPSVSDVAAALTKSFKQQIYEPR